MEKIANLYFYLEKKGKEYLEKTTSIEVEKQKRKFYIQHKIEPSNDEILEFKKAVIMRKGIISFLTLFIIVMFFLTLIDR